MLKQSPGREKTTQNRENVFREARALSSTPSRRGCHHTLKHQTRLLLPSHCTGGSGSQTEANPYEGGKGSTYFGLDEGAVQGAVLLVVEQAELQRAQCS